MRVEHEDVDLGATGNRVDGGRAGIARGGADDGDVVIAAREEFLEQQAEQLQRDVLESQGRTMEQFEHPLRLVKLLERYDGGMGEAAIGLLAQFQQALGAEAIANERLHDGLCQPGIGQPRHRCDLVRAELRPGFGHVEPAIRSEACERDALKIERGCLPPGADVLHGFARLAATGAKGKDSGVSRVRASACAGQVHR